MWEEKVRREHVARYEPYCMSRMREQEGDGSPNIPRKVPAAGGEAHAESAIRHVLRVFSSGLAAGTDEVDGGGGAPGIGAQGGGDVVAAAAPEERDGEIAAGGEGLWRRAGADLAAIFIKGDIPDVVEFVFDPPVPASKGEEVLGAGLSGRKAGDGVGDLGLDFAGALADASTFDPAELLDVGPGLTEAAGVADAGILGRVGQRPEDAALIAPVLGLGWRVHDDGEAGAALLPLPLLPDRQGRQHGRVGDQRQQRGKRRRRCRLLARAGCP